MQTDLDRLRFRLALLAAAISLIAGAPLPATASSAAAKIDDAALASGGDGSAWPAFGRTFSEQRYSPLRQIHAGNVERLGLAWSLELPGVVNVASQPLAAGGVLYFAIGHSVVHAVDAKTGKLLWRHDPEVAKVAGHKPRRR
jgi:quinohemoprotein ethanol dehydrogenase